MVFTTDNYYLVLKEYCAKYYENNNEIRIVGIYYYKPYKPDQIDKFKDFLRKIRY